jgi:hypothetical protein
MSGRKRRLPCPLRNFHAGVDCDGTLYMCNADLSLVYGNLHNEEPDKIWYNEKSREVRKKAERYFCHECTIHCDVAYSLRTEFFYLTMLLLKGK